MSSNWDPSKHPRHPKGSADGGKFSGGGGGASSLASLKTRLAPSSGHDRARTLKITAQMERDGARPDWSEAPRISANARGGLRFAKRLDAAFERSKKR